MIDYLATAVASGVGVIAAVAFVLGCYGVVTFVQASNARLRAERRQATQARVHELQAELAACRRHLGECG